MADSGKNCATGIVSALRNSGISVVATLPDAWLGDVIGEVSAEPSMKLIRVTREDEGLGICAGAWLGGQRGALIAQNAGLLLATNVLAGIAYHHQIPALMLIAMRGGPFDNQYYHAYKARVTEPVLKGVGIPYHHINSPDDFPVIGSAWQQASLFRMPVALLLHRGALIDGGA